MDLNEIRQQIDTVDNEIVALLEERMKLVTRVSAYKQRTGKAIYDPEREQALLDKVGASVLNPEYREAIIASFADIMLRGGDFDAFLQLVTASGDSSWEYLQNVIPAGYKEHQEMGVTIAAAKHYLQGKGAVRVHGGGFAGTAQAFVPVDVS